MRHYNVEIIFCFRRKLFW